MTRSQAYRLLNLAPGASEGDIRKRYKLLALKVHPDINPDPTANEQFVLLSQAVELLLSNEQPGNSGDLKSSRKASKNETPEEQKARMDQARMRFEQQKQKKHDENMRYFYQLTTGRRWFLFRWVVRLSTLLAVSLALDAFLPYHYEKDELTGFSKGDYNGILYDKITTLSFVKNGHHFAELERGTWLTTYPEVQLEKTWLLHTPVSFYSTDDFQVTQTHFDFHVGAIRWFMVLLFLVPLLTYFRRRKNLTYVFLYQFSFWFAGILAVYLLITQFRLVHLLTLGFL